MHLFEPSGLIDLLGFGARGLDVDCADDVEAIVTGREIGGHVILADLTVVAEEEIGIVLILLGRITARVQVPEMVVRVDDRHVEAAAGLQVGEDVHSAIPTGS